MIDYGQKHAKTTEPRTQGKKNDRLRRTERYADMCDDSDFERLRRECSDWERSLIDEVASGDYWLAVSLLRDLRKD